MDTTASCPNVSAWRILQCDHPTRLQSYCAQHKSLLYVQLVRNFTQVHSYSHWIYVISELRLQLADV